MKTLLLIDLQNDFTPGGSLAVPDGDAVVHVANRLMPDYDLVVATQDWHPAHHGSFAANHPGTAPGDTTTLGGLNQILWPTHCVQHTPGAEFHPDLNLAPIHHVIQKGTDPAIDSYSGFFDTGHRQATGLAELLQARGATAVDIMGLALDYCVKFTALDAVKLGLKTTLITEGCRAVNLEPGDSDRAVETMRSVGVYIKPNPKK